MVHHHDKALYKYRLLYFTGQCATASKNSVGWLFICHINGSQPSLTKMAAMGCTRFKDEADNISKMFDSDVFLRDGSRGGGGGA